MTDKIKEGVIINTVCACMQTECEKKSSDFVAETFSSLLLSDFDIILTDLLKTGAGVMSMFQLAG